MTPRTKWLLLGGLAVLGLYLSDAFYRGWIEQPGERLNAQLGAVTANLRDARDEQLVAQKVVKRLETYAGRALPYDPQLARSLYQEWLLDLVEQHRFASASIDAAQPMPIELRSRVNRGKRKSIGHRIAYSLRGRATLAKLAEFMQDFHRAPHLHKIRSLALNPAGKEGELDASFSIEVLGLEVSSNTDALSDWRLAEASPLPSGSSSDLVRRNLFARGFAQALNEIQLKAITFDRTGQGRAWLRVDRGGHTQTVGAGDRVLLALHDVSVGEILPDQVLLRVNQAPYWLKLGQSLGEVMSPPAASENPANAQPPSATQPPSEARPSSEQQQPSES